VQDRLALHQRRQSEFVHIRPELPRISEQTMTVVVVESYPALRESGEALDLLVPTSQRSAVVRDAALECLDQILRNGQRIVRPAQRLLDEGPLRGEAHVVNRKGVHV
jgi:hypothetical protein